MHEDLDNKKCVGNGCQRLNVRAKEFLCKHTNVTTCSQFRTRTLAVW